MVDIIYHGCGSYGDLERIEVHGNPQDDPIRGQLASLVYDWEIFVDLGSVKMKK